MLLATKTTWRNKVALLAEGVDRNFSKRKQTRMTRASPSSRRAWIEIASICYPAYYGKVALLAEGVDRNTYTDVSSGSSDTSPSSRRAWIEIDSNGKFIGLAETSPSSRRAWIEMMISRLASTLRLCRPPRGGRG